MPRTATRSPARAGLERSPLKVVTPAHMRGAASAGLSPSGMAARASVGTTTEVAPALQALGGARVVLSTVTSSDAMGAAIGGLGPRGQLVVLGVDMAPIAVPPVLLVGQTRSVAGHPSGTSKDSEDTLAFSALTGVRPKVEVFPLTQVNEAYERMLSNKARFRVVLKM